MKLAVKILLFVFIVFLSAPTIVSLIKKSNDTSCFYDTAEEEQSNTELRTEFLFEPPYELIVFSNPTSGLILSENLSKHNNIASTIFTPPPEQV
jgi:hypothetical protein